MGDWLRGNVDWALSRERYWGTPLPVWRCTSDSEHTHVIGSLDELEELSGVRLEDPHRPFVDEVGFPCPHCGGAHGARARGHRRVVRLGLDALRPVPRAVRERGALPGAQLRELRVRGARPDARLVLLAAGHQRAALRSLALRDRRLPRPHPRRRRARRCRSPRATSSRPRDVIDRFGADAVPLVLLHRQEPVGRLPLQRRDDRRVDPALPAPAVEHLRLPLDLRARARGRARPSSTAGSCRG